MYMLHAGLSTRPTRYQNILDLIISNLLSNVRAIDCLAISDHNMLLYDIHMKSIEVGLTRTQFDYNKADFESIKFSFSKIDFNTRLIGITFECWIIFKSVVQTLWKWLLIAVYLVGIFYLYSGASSISCFKRLLSDVDLSSFACCTYF